MDKENHKLGRLSQLSLTEQRRIVNQITSDKLDTNYINTIIQKPVHKLSGMH